MLEQHDIEQAVIQLQKGGIIAYPTEGVYGLGCDPFNNQACQRLAMIKQRPIQKGFVVVASEIAHVINLIDHKAIDDWQHIITTWPGAITWVVPLSSYGKTQLPGLTSLAVRISAHPTVVALCQQFAKPITSTSANLASHPPLIHYEEVIAQFNDDIDMIVPGKVGDHVGPTPIYDALTKQQLR